MPYIVKIGKIEHGEADGGRIVFETGETLPHKQGELADAEELGTVEWISDARAAELAENDLQRRSNRELRELCAAAGLAVSPRANKDELIALLEDADEDEATGRGDDAGQE